MGDRTKRFFQNERGATSIEYGLIAALVFIAMLGALKAYGDSMSKKYDYIQTEIMKPRA